MAFSFGQPSQPQQQPTTPSFSFGANPSTSSFGGFGAAQSKAVSFAPTSQAFLGFAQPAQQTASFTFSTASKPATTGLTFGQPASSTTTGLFGNLSGFTPSTAATGTTSLFAPTSLTMQRPTNLFGGASNVAGNLTGFSGFGQQQHMQQQQVQASQPFMNMLQTHEEQLVRLIEALSKPTVFSDDRDGVMGKLNYIQALLGAGKAVISISQPELILTPKNTFSRFKAYGYLRRPTFKNEDGLIGCVFAKTQREVLAVKSELRQLIHKLFGNQPNLSVEIDAVTSISDTQCELLFHINMLTQQAADAVSGGSVGVRRIPVDELVRFLSQPSVQQNLAAMSVVDICPRISSSEGDYQSYLESVPDGISPFDWYQALNENPRPDVLLPVPLIGMQDLRDALQREEQLYGLIRERIGQIGSIHEHVGATRNRVQERLERSEKLWREQSLRLMKLVCSVLSCTDRSRWSSSSGGRVENFEYKLSREADKLLRTLYGPTTGLSVRLKDLEVSFDAREKHLHQLGEAMRLPLSERIEPAKLAILKQICGSTNATIDALRRQLEKDKIELNEVLQTACAPNSSTRMEDALANS